MKSTPRGAFFVACKINTNYHHCRGGGAYTSTVGGYVLDAPHSTLAINSRGRNLSSARSVANGFFG